MRTISGFSFHLKLIDIVSCCFVFVCCRLTVLLHRSLSSLYFFPCSMRLFPSLFILRHICFSGYPSTLWFPSALFFLFSHVFILILLSFSIAVCRNVFCFPCFPYRSCCFNLRLFFLSRFSINHSYDIMFHVYLYVVVSRRFWFDICLDSVGAGLRVFF